MSRRLFSIGLTGILAGAFGSAMAFGDSTEKLEGKFVVYAGEVEQLSCPLSGKYDCLKWPTGLYKFKYKDVCVQSDLLSCSFSCNVIIASDKNRSLTLFHVEREKLSVEMFELYRCPSAY